MIILKPGLPLTASDLGYDAQKLIDSWMTENKIGAPSFIQPRRPHPADPGRLEIWAQDNHRSDGLPVIIIEVRGNSLEILPAEQNIRLFKPVYPKTDTLVEFLPAESALSEGLPRLAIALREFLAAKYGMQEETRAAARATGARSEQAKPENGFESQHRTTQWLVKAIPIALFILGVAIALVTNIASNTLPEEWKPYLWLWPLLFVLLVIAVILMRWQGTKTET